MKLKELRKNRGLTQKDIATKINVAPTTYLGYEKGTSEPDIETLKKLANIFQTTIDEIVENELPKVLQSQLTYEQEQTINKIKQLSEEQCRLVDAYIMGLQVGQDRREEILNKINKYIN